MTRRTHTKKSMIFHIVYIICLTVGGAACAYSAIYAFCHITCSEDIIAVSFNVLCAALMLAVDFFEIRAISAKQFMDDEGIGVKRFGKTKVYIKFDEVKEVGEGKIPTPWGFKERMYFCNRKLCENEKSDLITLKRQTVHFSCVPEEWFNIICEKISVPVANEIKEKYVGRN